MSARLLSAAPSSSGSTSPSLFSLSKWTEVLRRIPLEDLKIGLPDNGAAVVNEDTNNTKQEKYVQALLGDKILGSAAATALLEQGSVPVDTGSLTKRISGAVSNRFLAQHADKILPENILKTMNSSSLSEWEVGTAVEAAVFAVNQVDPDAVLELANYLIHESAFMTDPNCKGRLLELGGTIQSRRIRGGDHNPVFRATATLDQQTATAEESSKKKAETRAAAKLLDQLGGKHSSALQPQGEKNTQEDVVLNELPVTYDQWEPFENVDAVELQNGESAIEWWKRGAAIPKDAFQRAMMAPVVFPDALQAVDSWVRRQPEQDTAVFMVIVGRGRSKDVGDDEDEDDKCADYHTIPVHTAKSATKARIAVGLKANQIIAKLANVKLPSIEEVADEEDGSSKDELDRGCGANEQTTSEHPAMDFSQKTVPELKKVLQERKLPVSGKKAELLERLRQSLLKRTSSSSSSRTRTKENASVSKSTKKKPQSGLSRLKALFNAEEQ